MANTHPSFRPAEKVPPAEHAARHARPLLEIGWMTAGKLDAPDVEAIRQAHDHLQAWLRESFPEFAWVMPLIDREELVRSQRVEPVELLDYGVTERNLRRWDFTVILTSADLRSHYKNDAFAILSRSLQATVISTARIDPRAYHKGISHEGRVTRMTQRIASLVMHALGHLGGLEHDEDPESYMADFETVGDLDLPHHLGPEQMSRLQQGLRDVADRRLEERTDTRRAWRPWFYLRAAWINRRQLGKAIWQARPWQFPFRLSRVTTAAAAAMLLLMTTAEAWEVGLHQGVSLLTLLAVFTIISTTLYVLLRQRLFVRREHTRLSEASVITNVSTFGVVFTGMATTFLALCLFLLVFASLFYQPDIVRNWTGEPGPPDGAGAYVKLAVFVASLGMFIGALGASFEQQQHFRHITFVDEEI